MKNIKLLLKDIHGEIVEEDIITLSNDDTLLLQYPKEMSRVVAREVFERTKVALEGDKELLMIPEGITLKVIGKSITEEIN